MSHLESAGRPRSDKWEKTGNILAASFFSIFVYVYIHQLFSHFRTSLLLMLIKESLDITFFLCRKTPIVVTFRVIPWIIALGGTLTPLTMVPTNPATDSIIGETFQYVGLIFQILAILSLNRSWGIVPAIRDIKTHGTYHFVRHPLYLSYFISLTGFVINNFSLQNVSLLLTLVALQLYRIQKEEELLFQDQSYVEYATHTKWKMIPFIY